MNNNAIETMLARYHCQSRNDYENALKEIIQEIALLGLWRAKFFESAAFYGGTALRILYGLDRFSEDLDFSLLTPDTHFDFNPYNDAIKAELAGFNIDVQVNKKAKTKQSAIKSAFIKANTQEQLINIQLPPALTESIHQKHALRIKMEVDTQPPGDFETEAKPLLQPIPFHVNTFQQPDLFAGKIHALLCRGWQNRVKGRDWYDFVWYVARDIPIRLKHLKARLLQTQACAPEEKITLPWLIERLHHKIDQIDITQAKNEVLPFLKDPDSVAVWSPDFFKQVTAQLRAA